MRVIDVYDYDFEFNQRYRETLFEIGEDSFGVSHGYSYLHTREQHKAMGEVMGFDSMIFRERMEKENLK